MPRAKILPDEQFLPGNGTLPSVNTRHSWVRSVRLGRVPGRSSPMLDGFVERLVAALEGGGHRVLTPPDESIDAFLTTACFGTPLLDWRESLLFTGRKRFGLKAKPVLYTLIGITPRELEELRARFEALLGKDAPDPEDYRFEGLAEHAYRVLFDQGRRGGPMMSIARLMQGQFKTLRAILVVGDETPEAAYAFDLAGSHPRCTGTNPDELAEEVAMRLATALSTRELIEHTTESEPVPSALWGELETPRAMVDVSRALGERQFFTTLVRIADLVVAPHLTSAVSKQYSEGCFATWDATLGALIATVTGSRNPVEKGAITEDDLAVVTALTACGSGAVSRPVEGLRNDPPSSEAVELKAMDELLPWIELAPEWGIGDAVPVVRSKLHGHRGVASYDPTRVEFTPLDAPFYLYPVSCSTEAQAKAVCAAFARSEALRNPDDPRTVAFTVLPGHGMLMAEKWVLGKRPFEVLLEAMDQGAIEIAKRVPQGLMQFESDGNGRMELYVAGMNGRVVAPTGPRP